MVSALNLGAESQASKHVRSSYCRLCFRVGDYRMPRRMGKSWECSSGGRVLAYNAQNPGLHLQHCRNLLWLHIPVIPASQDGSRRIRSSRAHLATYQAQGKFLRTYLQNERSKGEKEGEGKEEGGGGRGETQKLEL